jgi:hypothetical protein
MSFMIREQQILVSAILWTACRLAVAQVGPVTTLEIETQGKVTYFNDVDYSKLSSSPGPVVPVGGNKPIEVSIGGQVAGVLYAGGFPGSSDGFQVDFRVPQGIASGASSLRLTAAWIAGPEVQIAIQ